MISLHTSASVKDLHQVSDFIFKGAQIYLEYKSEMSPRYKIASF